ncbi:hypothetical protein A0O36_02303 [Piscirickettsiaceae bacterium NZ-RLO1]|nr:hypothetical protein A0O36_02303 [Piscirickettsiaceae bacterium NZ-RLO1]
MNAVVKFFYYCYVKDNKYHNIFDINHALIWCEEKFSKEDEQGLPRDDRGFIWMGGQDEKELPQNEEVFDFRDRRKPSQGNGEGALGFYQDEFRFFGEGAGEFSWVSDKDEEKPPQSEGEFDFRGRRELPQNGSKVLRGGYRDGFGFFEGDEGFRVGDQDEKESLQNEQELGFRDRRENKEFDREKDGEFKFEPNQDRREISPNELGLFKKIYTALDNAQQSIFKIRSFKQDKDFTVENVNSRLAADIVGNSRTSKAFELLLKYRDCQSEVNSQVNLAAEIYNYGREKQFFSSAVAQWVRQSSESATVGVVESRNALLFQHARECPLSRTSQIVKDLGLPLE